MGVRWLLFPTALTEVSPAPFLPASHPHQNFPERLPLTYKDKAEPVSGHFARGVVFLLDKRFSVWYTLC